MNPTPPLSLSPADFDGLFPFHVGFRRDGLIATVGPSLRKICPEAEPGRVFAELFEPKRPATPFNREQLANAGRRLQTIVIRSRGTLLRGQFLMLGELLVFLGSPWLADLEELQALGLVLDDFAVHDPTLDLLQVLQLQRLVADDLQALAAKYREQSAKLAESARAKDMFLNSVSHELRTPLTGILGMSEILAEQVQGPLNERQLRNVKVIRSSGETLLKLINDVIELAKIGAGQITLERQNCAVELICQPAIERSRPAAERKKLRLEFQNNLPGAIVGVDARRMTQVLSNLLSNAIKFTAEGGECGLRVIGSDTEVRFEVWDRGIGIDPENLSKLFQPFVQLDGRLARRHDGTGLGLALVSQWVELHGGRVAAASTLGQGSQFTVHLARLG